jgi:hypothetical protein
MKQEQTQTLDLALEALEKIAQHEKECGERWGEATAELRQLREMAIAHSKKWERLAWLVVTVVVTGAASVVTTVLT